MVAVSGSSVELMVNISRFIRSLASTSFTRISSLSARSFTVMPSASMIVRVTGGGADGSGYLSDVLRAIYFAAQNGANVINMSFSLATYSQEMVSAIKFAARHQVICVASAGNDGKDEYVYPAALGNVMGVASTTNNDTLKGR